MNEIDLYLVVMLGSSLALVFLSLAGQPKRWSIRR